MEMLRRNLKRQTSRSPLSVASPADGQENLHPNLAAAPPSPASKPSTPPPGLSKPLPGAAAAAVPVPHPAAAPAQQRPVDDEPTVKVVVRVRPAVSLPVDGKDLFFVRKTSPGSIAVGDRAFAVDGFLDDRASQEDAFHLVGVPMIHSALAGFNTSLVCYGQTQPKKICSQEKEHAQENKEQEKKALSTRYASFFAVLEYFSSCMHEYDIL